MSNGIQRNGSRSPNKADESLLPPKVTSNHSYIGQSETRVYKRRWYILIMYCIIGIMQNAMWNTFGPIETTARAVYKWDGWVIDLIAAWGSVTFCITMLPFAWVVDVKGLRVGLLLSAGFTLVGSVLRFIPTGSTTSSTALIHCGQIIIGLASGIAAAPLLSSTWFPPSQRTTATAISSVASYVGTSLSFLVGPSFVDDVKDSNAVKVGDNYRLNETEEAKYQKQINSLLYTQSGLQAVFFFFVFVYYPSKPPSPPSHSAATVRVDFKDGARRLITNFNFLLLATIYGATTGVYGGWCAVLYQNLSGYGIDVNEHFAEWLGFVAVMSGAVSGVSFSVEQRNRCM
ncbi:solute carrier family 49 member 4-like isoform X2 [Xenia sp. Carnegie-2017]|uniref:solute carrier family 49 member 4-like isoform X2 n=1 Tax=Xenia sp. Carnegie-2017 TaxID=2897299 RepID=UPI001F037308|nr:solute carrier family 49 member 4-like isoform X2 [Xenia sp. Carnegie-2017]